MSMHLWAVIFDWDGVIVDSARAHEESWERLAREEGRTLPEGHFTRGFGMKNEYIIPNLLGWATDPAEVRRLSLRKEALYRQIIEETGIEPLPGVTQLLHSLRSAGIPCAVASSTPRLNITCVLERLGLGQSFNAIVAAEDVSRGKPDPEVFLLAAKALNVPVDWCVVFEDTPVGIQAARAGGMRVVAVTRTHPFASLEAADRLVDRLDALSVEVLERLVTPNAAA